MENPPYDDQHPAAGMSQDPFALADEPDRTSVLAILSLICSLACCIPGLGLIGSVLGVVALIGIGASGGRVGGRGLAIGGIVVGVLVSIAWAAGLIGLNATGRFMASTAQVVEFAVNDDPQQARSRLSTQTAGALSDDEILAFGDELEGEWGPYVGKPDSLIEYFTLFGEFASAGGGQQPQVLDIAQRTYGTQAPLLPVPLEFDNGTVLIAVLLDSQQGQQGMPPVRNVAVQLPDDSVLWLLDPDRDPLLQSTGQSQSQNQSQNQGQSQTPGKGQDQPETDPPDPATPDGGETTERSEDAGGPGSGSGSGAGSGSGSGDGSSGGGPFDPPSVLYDPPPYDPQPPPRSASLTGV